MRGRSAPCVDFFHPLAPLCISFLRGPCSASSPPMGRNSDGSTRRAVGLHLESKSESTPGGSRRPTMRPVQEWSLSLGGGDVIVEEVFATAVVSAASVSMVLSSFLTIFFCVCFSFRFCFCFCLVGSFLGANGGKDALVLSLPLLTAVGVVPTAINAGRSSDSFAISFFLLDAAFAIDEDEMTLLNSFTFLTIFFDLEPILDLEPLLVLLDLEARLTSSE
mmetsp:Transcript_37284/g.79488  ORF Transcript_37284/g.79488 Transcript_37284/m.79488 type:complete len:220 (-) Transcript_37284:761-1420(-)